MVKKNVERVTAAASNDVEYALSPRQISYLAEIDSLRDEYRKASGFAQKKIFIKMIHAFMQKMCGFPPNTYLVTTAAYGDDEYGSYPHVMPVAVFANPTLFYFTPSSDVDDIQDLWVKHGEVYLADPKKGDVTHDLATKVVATNFYVIDGWRKDRKTKEWGGWPAISTTPPTSRIDLVSLSADAQLDANVSHMTASRLASFSYAIPPDVRRTDQPMQKVLADLVARAGHESASYVAGEKRGEGPLNLPIFGLDHIEETESNAKPAALIAAETFSFREGSNGLLTKQVGYRDRLDMSRNSLICGDNLTVMHRLLEQHGACIDLCYIDPPFCSNQNYDAPGVGMSFDDKWSDGLRTYLPWLSSRLRLIHSLLKDDGALFVHLDWHALHYVKVELDKIFGYKNFRNEIIWHYFMGGKPNRFFARKHDTILFYSKSDSWHFTPLETLRTLPSKPSMKSPKGIIAVDCTSCGKESGIYKSVVKCDDVWDMSGVFNMSGEYTDYPTQKPEILLERIIAQCSVPNALIADFYSGSGTSLVVAQKLGRRWIGVDQNPQAVEVAADRIRQIANQRNKQVGIKIPDFRSASVRGYVKLCASHYHREDVKSLPDERSGRKLSAFQEFILDCYLPREGRKGDVSLHGFRPERGHEIAVFVGPNRGETTKTQVIEYLEATSLRKGISRIEVLGWSFSPALVKSLDKLAEDHGLNIELKKIHVSAVRIEEALKARNVHFLPAARATMDFTKSSAGLKCSLNILSPESEIIDIHWFIYPDHAQELEKIEYNFTKDETDGSSDVDEESDAIEIGSGQPKRSKKESPSLTTNHVFKGIKDGEYRVYVRITNRRGHPTSLIENIKIKGAKVEQIAELSSDAEDKSKGDAA